MARHKQDSPVGEHAAGGQPGNAEGGAAAAPRGSWKLGLDGKYRDRGGNIACEHGRERCYCKECGGASVCEHGRRRNECKECGGSQICEHGKRRNQCKECGGASVCEHGKRRNQCKECGGASICEHGKRRSYCSACHPLSVVCAYKRAATKRGLAWELTDAQALHLFSQPCVYCGSTGVMGIDRVKNEYGYAPLNVVPCCGMCNYMKCDFDIKTWLAAVKAIVQHSDSYEIFKRDRWIPMREELAKLGVK